jgi:hypothetical protein
MYSHSSKYHSTYLLKHKALAIVTCLDLVIELELSVLILSQSLARYSRSTLMSICRWCSFLLREGDEPNQGWDGPGKRGYVVRDAARRMQPKGFILSTAVVLMIIYIILLVADHLFFSLLGLDERSI